MFDTKILYAIITIKPLHLLHSLIVYINLLYILKKYKKQEIYDKFKVNFKLFSW